MPSATEVVVLKAGDAASNPFSTRDKVLVSVFADHPCKVRVLGQMDENDPFLPLSVQPGPPDEVLDLSVGIVLFSVAYMQGVAWMKFELVDQTAFAEDITFKAFLRSFPND